VPHCGSQSTAIYCRFVIEPPRKDIDLRDTPILEDVAEHAALVRCTETFAADFDSEERAGVVINIEGALNDTLEPFAWQFLFDRSEALVLFHQLSVLFDI
jgi:hypothetical protein